MNVLLVIAENGAVRQALQAALPESDMVLFENSVDEAGRRLVSVQADAILVDDSPALGAAAVSALRSLAPGTPVIALSGRDDLLASASLTRAGAAEVLPKPFSCEQLRQALDAHGQRFEVLPTPDAGRQPEPERRTLLNQHQMALRWLSRAAVYGDDPLRLSGSLVEAATDIFDTVRCAVLLEWDGAVRIVASHGIPESITDSLRFSYTNGIMRFFDERACLLDRTIDAQAPGAVKQLQLLGCRIAAPLLRDGRVFGAIVLGDKANGQDYSAEERELITLAARSTSAAFEQAAAHRRTARNYGQLDALFDTLDAGVVAVGPDRAITMMNPAAGQLLQLRPEDLIGRSVQKLGSAFADVALRALDSRTPSGSQTIHDPAVGAALQLNATPLNGAGIAVVFTKAPALTADSGGIAASPFWEYLSSRVAQEIKNPMVAINTFAQLLPKKYDSEDFREAFSQVVQKEVERINGVVETLFSFARNPEPSLKPCNVQETVQQVLRRFEDKLGQNAIELDTRWEDVPVQSSIDPDAFGHAVENVLQNSIDAMPEGGTLKVYVRTEGDRTRIAIGDTGPGIPKEDEDKVFLPFYSTKERGMGLGLPIASRILEQHQGGISLNAGEDSGSEFTIELPAKPTGT